MPRSTNKSARPASSAYRALPARSLIAACKATDTPPDERREAIQQSSRHLTKNKELLETVLNIVKDAEERRDLRMAGLRALQTVSFTTPDFSTIRAAYLKTLRTMTKDPDQVIRKMAIDTLMANKDNDTQKKLLNGLQNESEPLLPPEQALQLFSYDVHSGVLPIAKKIVEAPPSPEARREALRLLAADAGSAKVFEKLLQDKSESSEIRQVCAVALNAMKPKEMQGYARKIVMDEDETDQELKTLSLTALNTFGNSAALAADADLKAKMEELKAGAKPKVKQGARRFLQKYGE